MANNIHEQPNSNPDIPTQDELLRRIHQFELHDPRHSIYKVCLSYIFSHWQNHAEIADGISTLLLTWNQGFYRFGDLDTSELEKCLCRNWTSIQSFHIRDILSLTPSDEDVIKALFGDFSEALRSNRQEPRKGYVSAAKALHLLAPHFFPLWDQAIAAQSIGGYDRDNAPERYFQFSQQTKRIADTVKTFNLPHDRSLVKLIDEYNYVKYSLELE